MERMLALEKCTCGGRFVDEDSIGWEFCTGCGVGRVALLPPLGVSYSPCDRIAGAQSYTRLKRFKKYLSRAMRAQSFRTVPQETWEYLFERRPFRDSRHIQVALKKARNLRRKCYDSLPLLTAELCPHIKMPHMSEAERIRAIELFRVIDQAVREGPFISYLFCLEYILCTMGRPDMCQHINRIQCPKRREAYKRRLDTIFGETHATIMSRFRRPD